MRAAQLKWLREELGLDKIPRQLAEVLLGMETSIMRQLSAAQLGIDIGGSKIEAAVLTPEGNLSQVFRAEVESTNSESVLFGKVVDVATRALTFGSIPVDACGVGCPGPSEDQYRTVSPINLPNWNRFPLGRRLSEELGVPVVIDNDARAFCLAEGWRGAAVGVANYLGAVVSTGIGSGIVSSRRLLRGASGNAGELAPFLLNAFEIGQHREPPLPLWSEVSGRGLQRKYGIPASELKLGHAPHATGVTLGCALASVVALLDIELVVLGGTVALSFGNDFFDGVREGLSAGTLRAPQKGIKVVPALLGRDAPLIGAAIIPTYQEMPEAILR
jgi:glucokinase